MGGTVATVVGANETDAASSTRLEPSVIAVETTEVDAGDARPLLSSGDDDSAPSFRPGGRAGRALADDLSLLSSSSSSSSLELEELLSLGLYVPFAIFPCDTY